MNPTAADLLRLALHAHREGRIEAAIALYVDALHHEPENGHALRLLGEIALHGGQPERAVRLLEAACRQLPREVAVLVNLGAAHQALEAWEQAGICYRRALEIDPRLVPARSNLAAVLAERGDVAAAEREYAAVLALDPGFADAHVNLANLLRRKGDMHGALASYRAAIACNPDHVMAHHNLGGALLMTGAWAEGWAEYEWRWRLGENPALHARHSCPLWSGEDLRDRSLLVWGEQGVGDVVLFAGMLPDVVRMGARVTLEIDARLVPLFARSFPGISVRAWGAISGRERFDAQANIGRLGVFLRTDAGDFARFRPYLVPDPARAAQFRARYRSFGPGPMIGLAWRSNSPTHKHKSLALEDFAPLFGALPQATFVSLQYGEVADELAAAQRQLGVRIVHDDTFDNWSDLDGLAAQIAALDHVVTVSNLNAHLAGALGIPAHVLLTQNSLWYWPFARSTTPWYPSLTLVRVGEGLMPLLARLGGALAEQH